MGELRGAGVTSPDALRALGGALGGFPEDVIDAACVEFELADIQPYEPRMPTLAALVDMCRTVRQKQMTKQTKFCGRCFEGVVKRGNEFFHCDCVCRMCANSGWKVYGSENHFAIRCNHVQDGRLYLNSLNHA